MFESAHDGAGQLVMMSRAIRTALERSSLTFARRRPPGRVPRPRDHR
jgi:hypothetical protein